MTQTSDYNSYEQAFNHFAKLINTNLPYKQQIAMIHKYLFLHGSFEIRNMARKTIKLHLSLERLNPKIDQFYHLVCKN